MLYRIQNDTFWQSHLPICTSNINNQVIEHIMLKRTCNFSLRFNLQTTAFHLAALISSDEPQVCRAGEHTEGTSWWAGEKWQLLKNTCLNCSDDILLVWKCYSVVHFTLSWWNNWVRVFIQNGKKLTVPNRLKLFVVPCQRIPWTEWWTADSKLQQSSDSGWQIFFYLA